MRVRAALWICLSGPVVFAGEPDAALKSLYDAHDWPALRRALQKVKGSALYRGAVASAFNDSRAAELLLRAAIRSLPDSGEAYDQLARIYLRTGQYRKLTTLLEQKWASLPNTPDMEHERQVMAPFRGLPDQTSGTPRRSLLPHGGDIFLPVTISGGQAAYFFDTGAAVSCMSESEARRLGLAMRESEGTMGTVTSGRAAFRTAVARDVALGTFHLHDVSFAVFRDDQEPWSVLPPGRRGILGRPLLLAVRTLRWAKEGTVDIGAKPERAKPARSNLYFDGDTPLVTAVFGQESVLFTLDTGAENTDLHSGFAQRFPGLLRELGKKDTTEVRGVGGAESY